MMHGMCPRTICWVSPRAMSSYALAEHVVVVVHITSVSTRFSSILFTRVAASTKESDETH